MADKGPTTTTNQNSQSSPWAPAVPQLQTLLGGIGKLNTGVTPNQTTASNSLWNSASGLPNFGPQATNSANTLLNGGGATAQSPFVMDAYNKTNASLSPLTDPSNLNPFNTPGFSDAYRTMGSDISNSVNDRFAAAGRDLSPGNSTALARGLSQGQGQLISNQYNQNAQNLQGASNSLFGAGLNTGNALTGYNQMGNQNQLAGAGLAGQIPGLAMAPGQAQMSAANMQQMLPGMNLQQIQSLLTPIAALGGQSSGTQTTQTQTPAWQQALQVGGSLASMAGGAMTGNPMMMMGGAGGLFGNMSNFGNPGAVGSSAYGSGGAYSGATPSWQNGQYNPMF